MKNVIGSISVIKNFMGNAGRDTCNEYLYEALQDAVESMEKQIPREVIKTEKSDQACPICRQNVNKNFCSNCGQRLVYGTFMGEDIKEETDSWIPKHKEKLPGYGIMFGECRCGTVVTDRQNYCSNCGVRLIWKQGGKLITKEIWEKHKE